MDIVAKYIKELHNDNSTKEESLELVKLAKSGNEQAREKLIKNYLLYVVKMARRFALLNKDVALADLISEGNYGLMVAVDKFDVNRNSAFVSGALFWIRHYMMRNCVFQKNTIHLPENVINLQNTGRWKGEIHRELSIDAPNDEGESMAKNIYDSGSFGAFAEEQNLIDRQKVENILKFLKFRDAEIVKAYYGIGYDTPIEVEDVAKMYGLTTIRVHQILRNTIKCARTKLIKIVSAKYGVHNDYVDVTEKFTKLFINKKKICCSDKFFGNEQLQFDSQKTLIVEMMISGKTYMKRFKEGSFIKI